MGGVFTKTSIPTRNLSLVNSTRVASISEHRPKVPVRHKARSGSKVMVAVALTVHVHAARMWPPKLSSVHK